MKALRYIIALILILGTTSCHYLDIAPEKGLEEKDVFSKYVNFYKLLYGIYYQEDGKVDINRNDLNIQKTTLPMQQDANYFRFTNATMTDLADAGRQGLRNELIKAGTLGENCKFYVDYRCPVFQGGWYCISVCNNIIEHIDWLEDATETDKLDMLAQAYFLRAWFHMNITNLFGGQPYVDHVFQSEEEWDLPRLAATETYQKCAEDFLKAYELFKEAGLERRDPGPGEPGHLSNSKQNFPAGAAAMALRGRCLLYAASPLHNPTGDKKLWEDAAKANSEALDIALKNHYTLMDWDHWEDNCFRVAYCNEQIWAWSFGTARSTADILANHMPYAVNNSPKGGGQNPTQNAVDLYETSWGDPLFTQDERDAATAAGHYNEQNPYVNRDPRFYKNIIFDGATAVGVDGKINIYLDKETGVYPPTMLSGKVRSFGVPWNESDHSNTTTGYYTAKRWDGKYTGTYNYVTDPLIRLAEVYLNYAEAANMAYGPNGSVPGQISALEAVNTIRRRAKMPEVQQRFTGSAQDLNDRIINERTVEFMFEGNHYYIDERRWKIAPQRMKQTLMGMHIETCTADAEHPNGKVYIRKPIAHQAAWKDAMYYWFLDKDEAAKYKYYVNNETW